MIPHRLLVAVLAFIGLIVLAPMFTAVDFTGLSLENAFLAGLVIPGIILLFITSWTRPSLAAPILGVFVLVGFVVIAPTIFNFVQIGANEFDGFGGFAIQLAIPIIIIVYIVTMASERFA